MFNESFSLSLKNCGVDVELFSFQFLYPDFLFPGKTQYTSSPSPEGLAIYSVIHPINPLSWKSVTDKVIEARPDLVVFHYWMPFFAPVYSAIARGVKRNSKARLIAVTHNLIPHEMQPGAKTLARYFMKTLDGVVTLSSAVLNDLEKLVPGKRGIFLPHPVYDVYGEKVSREESLKQLGLDPSFRYLLFFGLVRDYKGLDILLEALGQVKSKAYKLIIAGEFYNKKERYLKIISEMKIEDRVIIRDKYIPDEEVKYYFSAADLVVQPYKSATQSGVTQIAYHFESPMLVSSVGGLPEIVPDRKAGYVVNPDPGEIATTIDEFLSRKDKDQFIPFIRKEKERFSWSNFTEKLLQFEKTL